MNGECCKILLVSANVGSIFEEPDVMFKPWLKAFLQCIDQLQPGLVAVHCQEVGGKNYEASMQHVNQFVKNLLACETLKKYDRARVFLDEDYTAADKFTALGNLYFVHESLEDVLIWDFTECKFLMVEGREVLSGNIENIAVKEKAKFPQHFFPEFKWSRKGFLRTRWSINNCIFDLVNIHLFHDASNIIAMQSSPSIYSGNRQQALLHTLQRFETDKYDNVPLIIFGDFNFRLDTHLLIQELTAKSQSELTKGKKDQVNKIVYTEEGNGKIVLTVETKGFDYHDKHSDLFFNSIKWLHQYDTEFQSFTDRLFEYPINFPPSYPFSEDINDGQSYMKTRCPSWCDRILLSHSAKDIVLQDDNHILQYNIIGKEVCMGDHKPVYLCIHLKPGKGNFSSTVSPLKLTRKNTLSINGEDIINPDLEQVNIHDFATFEKETYLLPEFKRSIRKRMDDTVADGGRLSLQNVALQIMTVGRVLKAWPRRPRSRHHSSSSEDFCDEDETLDSSNPATGCDPDNVSISTTVSNVSDNGVGDHDAEVKYGESESLVDKNTSNDHGSLITSAVNRNTPNVYGSLNVDQKYAPDIIQTAVDSSANNNDIVMHDVKLLHASGSEAGSKENDMPPRTKRQVSAAVAASSTAGSTTKCPCPCTLL